jgi:hypothetical protein
LRRWKCFAAWLGLPRNHRASKKLLKDVQAGKHKLFFANSPTRWSNNSLGLAWLEQVFHRHTAEKAQRRWRLLIHDGHANYKGLTLRIVARNDFK